VVVGGPIPAATPVVVAVDAMGGDYAPAEVVRGAARYLHQHAEADNAFIALIGDPARIEQELAALDGGTVPTPPPGRVRVVAASQVVEMHEHAMEALKEKPDSSIAVCNKMVRKGDAHASFSAGNTGAMMAAATYILERVEGVKRPAIATLFPTETGGHAVVIDAGANVDARPSFMLQFAVLGSVYAERALGIANPRVGLLSNGEEDSKGNEQVKEARALLQSFPGINFVGNVEGNHVFEGGVDVVVCDGFVGNVLLKGAEGIVRLVLSLLAAEARNEEDEDIRDALLASLLRLRKRVDYSEFGGAPLLGLNGGAFIAHGRSDYKAIASGIQIAARASRSGYVASIREALKGQASA
jgi:glycerol-3-phosphate acyltransferase PlsX